MYPKAFAGLNDMMNASCKQLSSVGWTEARRNWILEVKYAGCYLKDDGAMLFLEAISIADEVGIASAQRTQSEVNGGRNEASA